MKMNVCVQMFKKFLLYNVFKTNKIFDSSLLNILYYKLYMSYKYLFILHHKIVQFNKKNVLLTIILKHLYKNPEATPEMNQANH